MWRYIFQSQFWPCFVCIVIWQCTIKASKQNARTTTHPICSVKKHFSRAVFVCGNVNFSVSHTTTEIKFSKTKNEYTQALLEFWNVNIRLSNFFFAFCKIVRKWSQSKFRGNKLKHFIILRVITTDINYGLLFSQDIGLFRRCKGIRLAF